MVSKFFGMSMGGGRRGKGRRTCSLASVSISGGKPMRV